MNNHDAAPETSLLRTCKQVHAEATDYMHKNLILVIRAPDVIGLAENLALRDDFIDIDIASKGVWRYDPRLGHGTISEYGERIYPCEEELDVSNLPLISLATQ
jgi:hypothetical protein